MPEQQEAPPPQQQEQQQQQQQAQQQAQQQPQQQPQQLQAQQPPADDAPLLGGRYRLVQIVGKGSFGSVAHCIDTQAAGGNAHVAVKRVKLVGRSSREAETISTYLRSELENHRKLNHPHLVRLEAVFLEPPYLCVVMELAKDGNLLDRVNALLRSRPAGTPPGIDEQIARWWFQQLMLVLDYCHAAGVSHRDIKLENTLLQDVAQQPSRPVVKVADFGLSKSILTSDADSAVGTARYMAPEVLTARTGVKYDARKADVWSAGVLLATLLLASYPWNGVDGRHQLQLIHKKPKPELPPRLSAECTDLLERMLAINPDDRIDLAGILAHPWFRHDLPPAALTMTQACLHKAPRCRQSEAEIQAIAAAALAILEADQAAQR